MKDQNVLWKKIDFCLFLVGNVIKKEVASCQNMKLVIFVSNHLTVLQESVLNVSSVKTKPAPPVCEDLF